MQPHDIDMLTDAHTTAFRRVAGFEPVVGQMREEQQPEAAGEFIDGEANDSQVDHVDFDFDPKNIDSLEESDKNEDTSESPQPKLLLKGSGSP